MTVAAGSSDPVQDPDSTYLEWETTGPEMVWVAGTVRVMEVRKVVTLKVG